MLVLAIETSTSSAKAVLYDTEKGVVRSCQRPYGPAVTGAGETDARRVFSIAMEVGRKAAGGADVQAVALCGIWHGLCVCDREMEPLTPVYSWNFTKTAKLCQEIRQDARLQKWLYQNTGCMPHNIYPRHTIQYLAQNGLKLADKRFITQGGYNFYQLTGVFLESVSTHSGSGLIHLASRQYHREILDYLGIDAGQLAQLGTYRDVRPLTKEGAALLGLKSGIPVVPAHPDGALNQIGNYASRPGIMTLSVGTSGALRVTSKRPVLPKGQELWCYCGAEDWISGAAISGACNCVSWFVDGLAGGHFSYAQLEQIQGMRPDVPVFLPFLYGERCPGWRDFRRGGFFQVGPQHGCGEFYFALQMGILFNLYQCYQVLCRENGVPEKIIVSGGISNSRRWLQMLADIFQRDILVADYPNASSMGAVALGLHACGQLSDINEFSRDFDRAERIACDITRADYYQEQYERYLEAYRLY